MRTYVRVGRKSGVYFFSLDAASRIAVRAARALLNLPYYSAAMSIEGVGDGVNYRCVRHDAPRVAFEGSYEPVGPVVHSAQDSLEHFLTERYCLYHVDRRGSPYRLEIHHPPWPLQRAAASLQRNTMADASGISLPPRPPVLHFARRLDVVAWAPSRLP